jgi:EAL domain-containing protein (putative c-di-GMP-specific phosphodiesterase class I)
VETATQAIKLQSIGCYLMQGYLFSYPLNAQVFVAFAAHWSTQSEAARPRIAK